MKKEKPLSEKRIDSYHGFQYSEEDVKKAVDRLKDEFFISLGIPSDNEMIDMIDKIFGEFK